MKITAHSITLLICLYTSLSNAGGIYQEPDAFIKETFPDGVFEKKVIWLEKPMLLAMEEILSHKYKGLRISYWIHGTKTAWILDEIGKEKPITTGIVIDNSRIERVRILVFRESRGWEIRHAFFTDQFNNAALLDNSRLDTNIDNISGATLSVRAITKLSRIALFLHDKITSENKD